MKWYQKRWFKITAISATSLIIVILLAAGMFFAKWQTSSEKAILDAATHALRSPGTYHVTTKDSTFTLKVNGHKYGIEGKISGAKFKAVIDRDMLYINLSDPAKLYALAAPSNTSDSLSIAIKKALRDLRNEWVMVDIDDLAAMSDAGRKIECALENKNRAADEKKPDFQIFTTYVGNQFLTTRASDSSAGITTHRLSIDTAKLKSFYENLARIEFFDTLDECRQPTLQSLQKNTYLMEVETTTADHRLVSVSIRDSSGQIAKVTTDYSSKPAIVTPTKYVGAQQVVGQTFRYFISTMTSDN